MTGPIAPAPETAPDVLLSAATSVTTANLRQDKTRTSGPTPDSLFDFGKDAVKPAGKEHLDKLAADLRGVDFDVVTVTGHTDRIGSHAYNMKLSTRRVEVEVSGTK